jgi:hypothetical protein
METGETLGGTSKYPGLPPFYNPFCQIESSYPAGLRDASGNDDFRLPELKISTLESDEPKIPPGMFLRIRALFLNISPNSSHG